MFKLILSMLLILSLIFNFVLIISNPSPIDQKFPRCYAHGKGEWRQPVLQEVYWNSYIGNGKTLYYPIHMYAFIVVQDMSPSEIKEICYYGRIK